MKCVVYNVGSISSWQSMHSRFKPPQRLYSRFWKKGEKDGKGKKTERKKRKAGEVGKR
jgi:hypothetical protein